MKITIVSFSADLYGQNPKESRVNVVFKVEFAEGDFKELRGSMSAEHKEKHDFHSAGQIKWNDPHFDHITLSAKLTQAVKADLLKVLQTWVFGGGKCEG